MSSTIIIITPPPPTKPKAADDPDGFAQAQTIAVPYAEAKAAIEQAEAEGATVRIIGA